MTTTLAERNAFSIEPITYPVLAEKIGELATEYMPLRINGLDDSKGLKEVHAARILIKNLRVNVDKRRKELKAASLEYGRMVDSAAKQLTDLLEPIESHLQAEEDAVENEKARIKAAAEEAKRLKLQKRLDDMLAYGVVFKPDRAAAMTDEAWEAELNNAKTQFEIRQAEQAEAEKKRAAEEESLKAERERLAEVQRKQDEEAARLRAEQKRLDDAAAEQRRQAELAKAREEAAERARVETEQRIAREAAAKQAAEEARIAREKADTEAKEAARLKAESLRPQRERLLAVADAVKAIEPPIGPGSALVVGALLKCEAAIREIANNPAGWPSRGA